MPKVVNHEAYRTELLRDSFEVVARVGYGSLSMKQLAQSLNISTGLIYHYFKNKEEWFVSLVVHFSKATFDRLSQEIPRDASQSRKADLLVAEIARNREHYAGLIRLGSDFARIQPRDQSEGMFQMSVAVSYLYQHIALLFETDESHARALVAYVAGVIIASRLDPRGVDFDECVYFIRKLLDCPKPAAAGEPS